MKPGLEKRLTICHVLLYDLMRSTPAKVEGRRSAPIKKEPKLMARPFVLALLVVLFLQAPALAQVVFEDTFDGPTLDGTKWGVGTWQLGRT